MYFLGYGGFLVVKDRVAQLAWSYLLVWGGALLLAILLGWAVSLEANAFGSLMKSALLVGLVYLAYRVGWHVKSHSSVAAVSGLVAVLFHFISRSGRNRRD